MVLFLCFSGSLLWANTNKYRLTLRNNPATSIVIGWNQASGSNAVVHYGTVDYGTNWNNYPSSKSPSRQVSYKGMNNSFARLTGLTPNTAYYFVIRDSDGTSQRFWFKTAPNSQSDRLSFISGGDSRNNRTPRINANKLVSKLRPHAVLFGGDMTDNDTNSQWTEWFDDWQYTTGSDGRMIPIVATRGNHEGSNATIYNLFDTPSSEVYYALTFAGGLVRTYTLNTEMSISGNQTSWLQNDLSNNNSVTWKMAQYHKPMRPHVSSKSEGNSQYSSWASLFYDKKVKLVIECDAHTVKTTWPIRPSTGSGSDEGFVRDDANGTVYAGEGCWGAPLRGNNDNKNWTRNSGQFNQFKWIFVDQNKIEIRTVKVDNANQVGQVNDNNIFAAPSNLDVWNPSNGAVVIITNDTDGDGNSGGERLASARINSSYDDVEENQNGSMYMNSTDIELVNDGSKGNQTIGLRFNGLNIPQGATIKNAYVQFTTDETNGGSTSLIIKGHDADNSPAFTTASNNVSSRSKTTSAVNWSPATWSSIGQASSAQRTPELKSIVQEIVNRSGWSASSALSLIITGSGERTAESYDGSSGSAPIIYVTYNTDENDDTPTPPQVSTFSKRVASGNDDAEESSAGFMYLNSSDLELVNDSYQSAGNQKVGMRFTGVNIPQGAAIENAYIQFTVDETVNTSGTITVRAEATNSAAGFSTNTNNISGRNLTTASKTWNPANWTSVGAAGTDQRTPDISAIIQEVVNRSGWNSGNALAVIVSGSGKRVAESYNGSSGRAPLLVVQYKTSSSSARTTGGDIANALDQSVFELALEQKIVDQVVIYPNPFINRVTIDMLGIEREVVELRLYNLFGKVVKKATLNSDMSNEIDLSDLQKGQYIIQVISGNEVLKQGKIVKY